MTLGNHNKKKQVDHIWAQADHIQIGQRLGNTRIHAGVFLLRIIAGPKNQWSVDEG